MIPRILILAVVLAAVCVGPGSVDAAPLLELYVEGGVYHPESGTWVLAPRDSSGTVSFRLWTIGNVAALGPGGSIRDLRLVVAYSRPELGLITRITPSQVGGPGVGWLDGFSDPSLPAMPVLNYRVHTSHGVVSTGPDGLVTNGGAPFVGDGTLPSWERGFGEGIVWQEYLLGDLVLTDSPLGEFAGRLPTHLTTAGQINAYDVSFVASPGASLRLSLYGKADGKGAQGEQAFVAAVSQVAVFIAPEPPPPFVLALLGLTWAGSAWMFRYLDRWQELAKENLALAVAPARSACSQKTAPTRTLPTGLGQASELPPFAALRLRASRLSAPERRSTRSNRRPK